MESAVLIAAIVALAPTLAVISSHVLAARQLSRVEKQTNGTIAELQDKVETLKGLLLAEMVPPIRRQDVDAADAEQV